MTQGGRLRSIGSVKYNSYSTRYLKIVTQKVKLVIVSTLSKQSGGMIDRGVSKRGGGGRVDGG